MRRPRKLIRPRWLAQAIAWCAGYFWIACPLCKRMFAGFESAKLAHTPWIGASCRVICLQCEAEGKGERGPCPSPIIIDESQSQLPMTVQTGEHREVLIRLKLQARLPPGRRPPS